VCFSVLRCVAVWCRVLQLVAACCSVLQRVTACGSLLQCVAVYCSVLQCFAVCCSVLQCVAVCCSALQCVAVRCNALQCVAVCCSVFRVWDITRDTHHTQIPLPSFAFTHWLMNALFHTCDRGTSHVWNDECGSCLTHKWAVFRISKIHTHPVEEGQKPRYYCAKWKIQCHTSYESCYPCYWVCHTSTPVSYHTHTGTNPCDRDSDARSSSNVGFWVMSHTNDRVIPHTWMTVSMSHIIHESDTKAQTNVSNVRFWLESWCMGMTALCYTQEWLCHVTHDSDAKAQEVQVIWGFDLPQSLESREGYHFAPAQRSHPIPPIDWNDQMCCDAIDCWRVIYLRVISLRCNDSRPRPLRRNATRNSKSFWKRRSWDLWTLLEMKAHFWMV